jgi:AraC-like DNA-binding protein
MEPKIFVRPGVGIAADILQQRELEFKRLFIEQSVLIYVEAGIKSVRWEGGEFIIRAGEAIALAGGQSVDITNRLAPDGSYRAHWLVCDSETIDRYAELNPGQAVIARALPIAESRGEFGLALQRAMQAVKSDEIPDAIAKYRVAELLLWIGLHGGRFSPTLALTLSSKIRRHIGRDLSREWSSPELATTFAMSEATLRRKLADEGTSLSALMLDARLSFALKLLQSTRQPVTHIAHTVGYQTPSHFAARFKGRFGFSPTAVRTPGRAAHL